MPLYHAPKTRAEKKPSKLSTSPTPETAPPENITPVQLIQAMRTPLKAARSPQVINRLQNTIGNRALTQAAQGQRSGVRPQKINKLPISRTARRRIQRLMTSIAFDGTLTGDKSSFLRIKDLLDEYHGLPNTATVQQKFQGLNALDREVYDWINTNPTSDMSTNPNYAALKTLLDDSQAEYDTLVDAIKNDANQLPFDERMVRHGENIDEIKLLWASIVAGGGNIRLEGSIAFKHGMLGKLAKILQTPTGRKLLAFLNNPRNLLIDERVIIFEDLGDLTGQDQLDFGHIEDNFDSESSYARSMGGARDENFDEDKLDVGVDPNTLDNVTRARYAVITSANQMTQALLDGAEGVIMNGMAYKFKSGSGALVKIHNDHGGGGGNEDKRMMGTSGEEVIKPSFVTTAHELGHAARIRGGALLQNHTEQDTLFSGMGVNDPNERKLWDNPEEYLNITSVENTVREESGIHERVYHKPISSVEAQRRKVELEYQMNGVLLKDNFIGTIPEWTTMYNAWELAARNVKDDPPNSFTQEAVYLRIKQQITNIDNMTTPAWLKPRKLAKLQPKIDELKTHATAEKRRLNKWGQKQDFKKEVTRSVKALKDLAIPGADIMLARDVMNAEKARLTKWVTTKLTVKLSKDRRGGVILNDT